MLSLNGSKPKPAGDPRAVYIVIGHVDRQLGKVSLLNCPERRYSVKDGDLLQLTTGGVVCIETHPHHGFTSSDFDMMILEVKAIERDYQDTIARAAWYTQ